MFIQSERYIIYHTQTYVNVDRIEYNVPNFAHDKPLSSPMNYYTIATQNVHEHGNIYISHYSPYMKVIAP